VGESPSRCRGWLVALVTNGDSGIQEEKEGRIGLAPPLDACLLSGAVGIPQARSPEHRVGRPCLADGPRPGSAQNSRG
jgi:hypothetical protein